MHSGEILKSGCNYSIKSHSVFKHSSNNLPRAFKVIHDAHVISLRVVTILEKVSECFLFSG